MSGGTTSTQTNSISPYMEEAAKTQLGKATALTDTTQNPYKQYEGQRIAEFNPMQQQFFQGIGNLQGSGAINQGIGAAGDVTQRALSTQYNPYQTGQFNTQASQYMDPYMQNVVDIQQREAQRQADIARTQSNAVATKSGAFGGGRQAVVDAEAARNLATQKGDIQARGLQDAYSRAQQMFNTEQALGEQSRQYGAGLGMKGLETALSGASQLGGLGSTQFGQQKDILGLQNVAGAQQQAQEQAKLSQGYEDFLAKEKYPYQQLEFMSNIMRGTPYGTTTSMYSPGPSTASTLLGAGTSLAGAYMLGGGKLFGAKEGGLADAYAAGGSVRSPESIQSIADNLLDAQLPQAAALAQARGDKQQDDIVQQEMASRAALRSVAQAMPEDQGIAQLPAGDMNYANGGIIAFADGGDVERYQLGGSTAAKTGPDFIKFLQRIGVDYFDYAKMTPAEKAAYATQFEQAKAASTAAPASAAPVAQAAQNTSKAFSAGKAAAPYLDKAGKVVKSSAIPVLGGGLSAAQGLSEIDSAKAFYDDPNVSTYEKAKQFARTGANAALPLAGGIVGSGVTPFLGTAAGTLAGTGLAALIDDEGEALKQYRAKNEPPKGPTAVQNRAAINASEAASRSAPALSDYPTTTTGSASGTPPVPSSTLASSTLSPSSMAKTQAGRASGSSGTSAGGKGEPDIFSPEGVKAAHDKFLGDDAYKIGALKNQLVQMNDRFKTQADERLALRKKEIEEEGDVYKDRSDRILARETKLKDQGHQNMGLAFLNAGLAIMSTPGGLATALGKGAQVGTAQYAAGIDKLRAAQERLDDAKERIDDLRLNRKDLNKRDIRQLERERDTALQEGEKLVYGLAKDVYGLDRGDASKMFDKYFSAREKKYEQDQMTQRTMATIASSSDNREKQIWKGLMQKHSNDPVAAAVEWNAMQSGDRTSLAAEKLVQDRVGEYEKANKIQLSMMTPPQREAAIRKATEQYRKDIYTQFKLTPTMGAGASSTAGFRMVE
jgi:hypothetical protein